MFGVRVETRRGVEISHLKNEPNFRRGNERRRYVSGEEHVGRNELFRINFGQVPGERFAVQSFAQRFARRNVTESALKTPSNGRSIDKLRFVTSWKFIRS